MSVHRRITTVAALGAALLAAAAAPAAASSLRIEKHLALAPGGRLVVDSEIGNVVVRGDAATGAAILLTGDRGDLETRFDLTFEATPGEVHVSVKHHPGTTHWFSNWSDEHVKFAISVPKTTAASIHLSGGDIDVAQLEGGADLRSSGGSIAAQNLGGHLVARSSGGDVTARDIQGAVELASSGGGVQVERVTGDIEAKSSGGDVHVQGAGGRVVAGSSGGSVHVAFAPGNAHGGEVKSSGGDVEVRLDPAAHLTVDAASSGGDVTCDLPLTVQGHLSSHRISGSIQGGGALLTVRSSGGGVTIAGL